MGSTAYLEEEETETPTHDEGRPNGGAVVEAVWTFLTNHSHVLICLARDPSARLRDVADEVGITERAVQRIVTDLENAGVLTRMREGRRNRYQIHADRPLRHPVESHRSIRDLLSLGLDGRPVAHAGMNGHRQGNV